MSVIRSASDREVLAVAEDVSPSEAERIATRLSAEIEAGEYPEDARVWVMGGRSCTF